MFQAIENLFYPTHCLHCDSFAEKKGLLICKECSLFFEFLDSKPSEVATCFAYYEAVASFVKALKGHLMPYLSDVAAAFLLLQLTKIGWEGFDLIMAVPSRKRFYWNDPVHRMARCLASDLGIACKQPMVRLKGRPKQALLSKEERLTISSKDFLLKEEREVRGKSILLIDDVMTTGSTLRAITALLYEAGAKEVRALTLAETLSEENRADTV